jgi:hypothetical protein
MVRTALAGMLLAAGLAIGQDPEFEGHCAMSAALGNKLPTSCGVVWISPQTNKLYCFSSDAAKAAFLATASTRRAPRRSGRTRASGEARKSTGRRMRTAGRAAPAPGQLAWAESTSPVSPRTPDGWTIAA